MSGNQFTISSGWEPRPDPPAKLGQRVLQNLDALSAISPYFCNWEFLDLKRDPREMTSDNIREFLFPLSDVREFMTEMVERGMRRNELRQSVPGSSCAISVSNENPDRARRVCLSASGGGPLDPRAGLRFAKFETGRDMDPDPEIVSYPVFKAGLTSIVSAWDVRVAQAYSCPQTELWSKPKARFLDLAWMTYLSPELAQKVTPPGDVLVERMDDGGLLMIAAQETFDTWNTKHMAAARSITNALEGINSDEERRWKLLWPTRNHRHQ